MVSTDFFHWLVNNEAVVIPLKSGNNVYVLLLRKEEIFILVGLWQLLYVGFSFSGALLSSLLFQGSARLIERPITWKNLLGEGRHLNKKRLHCLHILKIE